MTIYHFYNFITFYENPKNKDIIHYSLLFNSILSYKAFVENPTIYYGYTNTIVDDVMIPFFSAKFNSV